MQNPQDAPTPGARRAAVLRRYLHFWRPALDRDVDEELRFHHDMRVADLVARGLSPDEAHAAARARFGDLAANRQHCLTIAHRRERRMTRALTLGALRQDVAFAFRTLGRQRSWTAVAVLTLGLGIGANTAVFSVVNGLLLNPLPYRDADRVALLWQADEKAGMMVTPDNKLVDAWRRASRSLETIEQYGASDVTLTGRGDPVVLHASSVTPSFLSFTGASMLRGRSFAADEAVPNGPGVALLSERLWNERFGRDPGIVGKRITIDGTPRTVIGVTGPRFRIPAMLQERTDVWLPLVRDSAHMSYMTIARLRSGVALESAERELDAIAKREKLDQSGGSLHLTASLHRPRDMVPFGTSLTLLWGAVGVLLLIACANVAHLLVARGASREREMAIRTALGASRARLFRQLATESAVLALGGCLVGLGLGVLGLRAIVGLRPESLTQLTDARFDGTVVALSVGLALLTGLAFGVVAAVHAARHGTADTLKATALSGTGGPRSHRFRSLLVVTEMALAGVLLVGATLLVRSVINLQRVDPGFRDAGLYTMKLSLPPERYGDDARRTPFAQRLFEEASRVPGLSALTIASTAPPASTFMLGGVEPEGGTPAEKNGPGFTAANFVRGDYFSVVGIPMREGATFTTGADKRSEVIINAGAAKRFWPGEEALGKRLRLASPMVKVERPWHTVVGITEDVAVRGVSPSSDRSEPILYFPSAWGSGMLTVSLIFRMTPGAQPYPALRQAVLAVDPRLPPPPLREVSHEMNESIATTRFTMSLLGVFAGLAVLLSAIGLYGVIAYVVAQRTREIGIRIALGGAPRAVARGVVRRGLVLATVGLAIGLVAAGWATKLLQSNLYGVAATDPVSFVWTALVLLGVAALACVVPMRRAMAVDPVIAMRAE